MLLPRMRSFVLVTSLMIAAVAAAAPPDAQPETSARAKELFVSARRHFDLTEYPEALYEFREAYVLKDDPALLYDVAQCYRLMHKAEDALRFYRTYVRRLPEAKNRADVETKMAALEEEISTQEKTRPLLWQDLRLPESRSEPLVARDVPKPNAPLYKKWWLWTAVGGVVVVGVAVGLGVGLSGS